LELPTDKAGLVQWDRIKNKNNYPNSRVQPFHDLHQDVERASYKRDGRSAQQDHLVGDQDEDAAREER
jgi:hypothetical protein